jgi:hypothetical protein
MNYIYAIGCFIVGAFSFWLSYSDRKRIKPGITLEYVQQIKGYLGAIGFIILGILQLVGWFKK